MALAANMALASVLFMGTATYLAYMLTTITNGLPAGARGFLSHAHQGLGVVNIVGDLGLVAATTALWIRRRPECSRSTGSGIDDGRILIVTLAQQRCRNHLERSAAGRCPTCSFFYCRECITEHAGRLLCAACVQKAAPPKVDQRRPNPVWTGALLLTAFSAAWFLLAAGEGLVWQMMRPK